MSRFTVIKNLDVFKEALFRFRSGLVIFRMPLNSLMLGHQASNKGLLVTPNLPWCQARRAFCQNATEYQIKLFYIAAYY